MFHRGCVLLMLQFRSGRGRRAAPGGAWIALVVLPALLVAAPHALAFEGRVVDEQGRPVANAEVTVLGRPGAVRTDAAGSDDEHFEGLSLIHISEPTRPY